MKAVDTNVLVRALVRDDPTQSPVARAVLKTGAFVTSGVWIETGWVLHSAYGWQRAQIADAFRRLIGSGTIFVSDEAALLWAIDRYAAGADWADMIHLVDTLKQEAFLTFDKGLPADAGADTPTPIERLP